MPPRERRNPVPIAISFLLHAALFIAVLSTPGVRLPHTSDSEYKQKIKGNEPKLVWYKFRKELPAVSPSATKHSRELPRADTLAKQRIVSAPKDAPKRDQTIWTPAPELAPAPPVESPNILAVKLPDPPKPAPKEFTAPPEAPRPALAKVELAEAPPLSAPTDARAPELGTRLPPKPFIRPDAAPRPIRQPVTMAEAAPALQPGAGAPIVGLATKLPPRPFTPPPGRSAPSARPVTFESPDNLNVAVVGLKPSEVAAVVPALPSPGQFSAGPRLNPKGSAGEAGPATLTVPGLFVAGARTPPKPDLMAHVLASPTSPETIRAAMRNGEVMPAPRSAPASAAPPGAAKVSSAPDPRFNGRDIYMMAIQLPNITSNSGSWLMWYSDRMLRDPGHGPVTPPVPRRKVDPKYIASAVADKVEGRVQLACVIDREGKVSLIETVRSLDERLDESAKQALEKWEFSPALRNGEPVDVDVLVEIPFRLPR